MHKKSWEAIRARTNKVITSNGGGCRIFRSGGIDGQTNRKNAKSRLVCLVDCRNPSGDFRQSEYGKVILPFVVMRRLDCILEGSKGAVLAAKKKLPEGVDDATRDMILFGAVGGKVNVYNLSRFNLRP